MSIQGQGILPQHKMTTIPRCSTLQLTHAVAAVLHTYHHDGQCSYSSSSFDVEFLDAFNHISVLRSARLLALVVFRGKNTLN